MPEVTYYVALPFVLTEDGIVPGEAAECASVRAAILRAEILSRMEGHSGAVAFSRTGDPDQGAYGDPVVLKRFGDIPDDLSMLF